MTRGRRRALFVALALAGGLVIVLTGLETSLRLAGQANLRRLVGSMVPFRPEADIRILCLGDSYTYGIGAKAQENYPMRLQMLLNEKFGSTACQVANWARPGQNSSEALLGFDLGLQRGLRPDFVLVALGVNNVWNWHLATPHLPGNDSLLKLRAVLSGFRLWRLALAALRGGWPAADKLFQDEQPSLGPDQEVTENQKKDSNWQITWLLSDLRALDQLCRNSGATMVLVAYHMSSQSIQAAQNRLARESQIPLADCLSLGHGGPIDMRPYLSADGWHPNARGYAAIAAIVFETIAPLIEQRLSATGR